MVAAALVLIVVGGLLAAILSGNRDSRPSTFPGSAGIAGSPVSTPVPHPSIWSPWPEARAAYEEGRGARLGITQTRNGYGITLNWAGVVKGTLFVYFTISSPPGQVFNSLNAQPRDVSLASGTTLNATGTAGCSAWYDGLQGCLFAYDVSGINGPAREVALHVEFAGITGIEPVPATPGATPIGGASAGIAMPKPTGGQPERFYRPGDPVAFITVPGPFGFDFRVPFEPAATPTPSSTTNIPTRLSAQDAISIAQTFLGQAGAGFDVKLVDTAQPPQDRGIPFPPYASTKLFLLTWQGQPAGQPDALVIDADTGEVLKAVMPSRIQGASPQPVTNAEAQAIAERFAREHFTGFDQLTAIDGSLNAPDGRYLIGSPDLHLNQPPLVFQWRLRDAATAGWLPTWVSVSVDGRTGQVVSYLARHSDNERLTPPAISREQAVAIALQQARRDEPDLSNPSAGRVELVTEFAGQGHDRWLWVVELAGAEQRAAARDQTPLFYAVDAVSGEVTGSSVLIGGS